LKILSAERSVVPAAALYRVGKPLRDTLSGFHSARLGTQRRVLYRIDESKHAVIVQDIQHRSSAYHPSRRTGRHPHRPSTIFIDPSARYPRGQHGGKA